jgi:hypothetical protein
MGWSGERRRQLSLLKRWGRGIAFFGVFMTKTANKEDRGILAFTKAGRYNVYTLISEIDVQSRLGVAGDSGSPVIVETDFQKEAEIFLSSIVLNVPERGIGVTPQDWFDNDELDRDLTPLIEQQAAKSRN